MKSTYHITNECAVNKNFATQIAADLAGRSDDQTFLYAAPAIGDKDYCGKTVVYLSTNGDPVFIGTWAENENVWCILDDESADDATEDYPNTAVYLKNAYGIESYSDIEALMSKAGVFE